MEIYCFDDHKSLFPVVEFLFREIKVENRQWLKILYFNACNEYAVSKKAVPK